MITLITGFKLGLQANLPLLRRKVLKQKQNLYMRLSGATTQEIGPCMKSLVRL